MKEIEIDSDGEVWGLEFLTRDELLILTSEIAEQYKRSKDTRAQINTDLPSVFKTAVRRPR